MALAERNAELVRNGCRLRGRSTNGHIGGGAGSNNVGNSVLTTVQGSGGGGGGTSDTRSDNHNSIKCNRKTKKQSEYKGKIRVGRDFQAICPPLIPEPDRKPEMLNDRALLVWSPTKDIPDAKLEKYISVAEEKYNYNGEQALSMLFWHKHDLERAVIDLANFSPFPDEWTVEEKVLFEQAFQFHGKSFHHIRQMLPNKTIASLVKYYYSWKKTRHRPSVMDRQEKAKASKEGSENGSDNGSNEKSDTENNNKVQINKQNISTLKRKSSDNLEYLRPVDNQNRIISRWTNDEILMVIEGIRKYGKDFLTIADTLGTKSEADVRTFYMNSCRRYNLDQVLKTHEAEKEATTQASSGTSIMAGSASANASNETANNNNNSNSNQNANNANKMVRAERNAELVRNGRRLRGRSTNGHVGGGAGSNNVGNSVLTTVQGSGGGGGSTSDTRSDNHNSIKRNRKTKKQSEYKGKIRVGRDFQAICPPLIPEPDRKPEMLNDRALLVWSPTKDIPDAKLEEYISFAEEKYNYNGEQALSMLFWHKHDLERAVIGLANYSPIPDEWTVEDKVLFEQAFQFHGKSFHLIRQILPNKTIASLVKYYYSWKKTRHRPSVMDRQEKAKAIKEGSENGSDNGSNEEPDTEDNNKVQINKQNISTLKRKSSDNLEYLRPVDNQNRIISRWTNDEILMVIEGILKYGKDFMTIADTLGTKTEADVRTFYMNSCRRYNLDQVLKTHEAEKEATTQASSGTSIMAGSASANASNETANNNNNSSSNQNANNANKMVLAERNAELVRNGRRLRGRSTNGHVGGGAGSNNVGNSVLTTVQGSGGGGGSTSDTRSDNHNSIKRKRKTKKQSEYKGKIRVGRDFQAVCPPLIPEPDRKPEMFNDRALLVWSPTKDIPDAKLEEYISFAEEKYSYYAEQALSMLFWHKHDLERAVIGLANYSPIPDEWTVEDKVLFEQAFQFHGKSFHHIRQMLPNKTIASLVKYYYSWKKTRHRPSVMDRQEKAKASKEGSENGSDNGSNEEPDTEDNNKVQINKQNISTLKRKSSDNLEYLRPVDNQNRIISRWTNDEILMVIEGIRKYGKDFMTIADTLGTKTEADVRTFYMNSCRHYNLDQVLKTHEAEKEATTQASSGTSIMAGSASANASNETANNNNNSSSNQNANNANNGIAAKKDDLIKTDINNPTAAGGVGSITSAASASGGADESDNTTSSETNTSKTTNDEATKSTNSNSSFNMHKDVIVEIDLDVDPPIDPIAVPPAAKKMSLTVPTYPLC